jgi:catechol 2,3-dioxygenase-like lactoylglutathione lyase family enzyme
MAATPINGVAHVILTARSVARSAPFYRWLGQQLGLACVIDSDDWLYLVGGRTALGIVQADGPFRDDAFVQRRCGLHHVCFRLRSRGAVDKFHDALLRYIRDGGSDPAAGDGPRVVHGPENGKWAPGYYSVLFEDRDGIRIELNFVPGTGLLDERGHKARSPGAGMPSESTERSQASRKSGGRPATAGGEGVVSAGGGQASPTNSVMCCETPLARL